MTPFSYRALATDGRIEEGSLLAVDRLDATRRLRQDGLTPIRLNHQSGWLHRMLYTDIGGGPSAEQRLRLLETLHFLVDAGLVLEQALVQAQSQMADKPLAQALSQAREKLQAGMSLSQALTGPAFGFSAIDLELIAAGEAAGALSAVLAALSRHHARRLAFQRMMAGALIYPGILTITALGVIALLVTVVVPQFEPVFAAAGSDLPTITAAIRDFSYAATKAAPALFLMLLLLRAWLAWTRTRLAGRQRLDQGLLRLPWIGARLADAAAARLLRGLETMIEGGVPLHHAMRLLANGTGNAALDARAGDAAGRVMTGAPLWRALADTQAVPASATQLLRIGEETGKLSAMLGRAATLLEQNTERQLSLFATLLTPAVTLIMGLIVGLIVWAVMAAVLDINRLV